ncbi:hypothetical protein WJX73_010811 [Symbiochloris irregularis]|uniref:NADPH-dependent diflavin oxidoreductase 1 n=1 Tax=Symbiochloris irregularis TaxID=706552 RepID=A0AAW1NLB0_9CHLO
MGTDLLILFGSQTGNAQDVAESVGRSAQLRQLTSTVVAMDAFDIARLHEQVAVIFIASTTGQGETPDNMKQFWRFLLRKSLPTDALNGMQHAVFGLGDSGYQQYNTVAKKLDRRLAALGSAALLERGLGDDQHFSGYDSALFPWLEQLWAALQDLWPHKDQSVLPGSEGQLPTCKYSAAILNFYDARAVLDTPRETHEQEVFAWTAFTRLEAIASGLAAPPKQFSGCGPGRPFMASVIANRRITSPDHFQDTRHIELDLASSGIVYEPGDLLNILPRQNPEAVQRFLRRTGLDAQSVVRLAAAGAESADRVRQSVQVTVGSLVAGALDIHGACPKRFFFEILAHFATEPHETERLLYFASSEGRDDLSQYNTREGRTVLEALEDFPSAQVPLQWLLSIVPRIKPRQFSIASSLRAHPHQAHITAAIVDYKTPHKRRKQGLCTGVAPFRAFLEERAALQAAGNVEIAPCHLYFGCRGANQDFYYKEQWQEYVSTGVLAADGGLVAAFSRQDGRKVYVTHRIREHAQQLFSLLTHKGASVYISGSATRMPQDVIAALEDVVAQQGQIPQQEAKVFLKALQSSRRCVIEAWS